MLEHVSTEPEGSPLNSENKVNSTLTRAQTFVGIGDVT